MASEEKLQTGRVIGNKMDKTVVVRIDRHKRHRLYGKTMSVTRRYKAHDEKNECGLGDIVKIAETRPMSREKRWRVVEIVTKGDVAEVAPREIGAHIIEDTLAAAKAEDAERAAMAPPVIDAASSDVPAREAAPRKTAKAAEMSADAAPEEAAPAASAEPDATAEPDQTAESTSDEAAAAAGDEPDAAPASADNAAPTDEGASS